MTDPPYGGGGGSDGAAEDDLMLGLGDLDVSKLSHEDKLGLECKVLKMTWVPTPPGATFCEHFWGETISSFKKWSSCICSEVERKANLLGDFLGTNNVDFCSLDRASCWPPTRAGTLAVISCFEEFKGIKYDHTSKKQ